MEEIQGLDRGPYDMDGLKLAFWGMLFTVINFRIQGFDIVPDFIGYIMVAIGLSRIEQYEETFSVAKKIAYIMTVLSLINIYQAPAQSTVNEFGMMENTTNSVNFSAGIFGAIPWLATVFLLIGTAASLAFFYYMCIGMKSLLSKVGDMELAEKCDARWKLILASEIGLIVSMLLVILILPLGFALALIFGVLSLIALILFLILMYKAYDSIHNKTNHSFEIS